MSDPRICIIGAGHLSTRRIYPHIGAAGAQLVGVCDLDRDKGERNARRFGGAYYPEYAKMLEEQRPDGVIVCIGPQAHARLAIKILQLGYHVYTEKPPAPTAAEALEVARVARAMGRTCTTAFKKRHAAAYVRAKDWVAQFHPNQLLSLSIDFCSAPYRNDRLETDFLLDFGLHAIDLCAWLFGDVAEVSAFSKNRHAYAVALRFTNGAVGTLNLNDGRSFTVPTEEVELTAADGNAMTVHNSSAWRISVGDQGTEWRKPATFTSAGDSGNDTGHLAEIGDFVRSLREPRVSRSDIYESYKSMLLYEAIERSAATGTTVRPHYATLA